MKIRTLSPLVVLALLLSSCGNPVTEAPAETASTPASQEVSNSDTTGALLIWESADRPCETAAITPGSLSTGECGSPLTNVSAQITEHSSRFSQLSSLYAPFTAETPAGNLIFKGFGVLVPSDAEKRALAEWARLMFQIAQAGRTGASWGRAFAWNREGGPGGFCDNVVVYLTGWVTASDCKGYNVQGYLTASQLDQLYIWVDSLTVVDHTQTFPAETGGLKMTLALAGNGQAQADDQTLQDIFEFAATLYTELGYAAEAGADVRDAQQVLEDYLTALHLGDYNSASTLYGDDVSLLQTWNPDLGDNLPALFERACRQNGLQCLAPRSITYRAPEADGYHFYVEFNNEDFTLFRQGPCCGETGGIPVSMFSFYVEKRSGGLAVTDLPPYAP